MNLLLGNFRPLWSFLAWFLLFSPFQNFKNVKFKNQLHNYVPTKNRTNEYTHPIYVYI